MSLQRGLRRSVLIVAALDAPRDVAEGDEPPMAWHVDAMVVALARAAVAHGVGLVVPAEPRFSPLMADIVSEYAAPREAEGMNGRQSRDEFESAQRMLSFVSFGSADDPSAGGAGLTSEFLREMGRLQELGMIDDKVTPISGADRRFKLRAVVLVGSGTLITQALRSGAVTNLPKHRFLMSAEERERPEQEPASGIADTLDREFVRLKSGIQHYAPRSDDSPSRDDEVVEPADFWRYPAYLMYADRVMSEAIGQGAAEG